MAESQTQDLLVDRLCSGDRPSVYAAGMVVAQSLKTHGVSILVGDALGRVVVLSPAAVSITSPPRVPDSDLNSLSEEESLSVMVLEGRTDDEMVAYLRRREEGLHGRKVL